MQVTGSKQVVFFPPSEYSKLYITGSSSAVLDINEAHVDGRRFPKFTGVKKVECTLQVWHIRVVMASFDAPVWGRVIVVVASEDLLTSPQHIGKIEMTSASFVFLFCGSHLNYLQWEGESNFVVILVVPVMDLYRKEMFSSSRLSGFTTWPPTPSAWLLIGKSSWQLNASDSLV